MLPVIYQSEITTSLAWNIANIYKPYRTNGISSTLTVSIETAIHGCKVQVLRYIVDIRSTCHVFCIWFSYCFLDLKEVMEWSSKRGKGEIGGIEVEKNYDKNIEVFLKKDHFRFVIGQVEQNKSTERSWWTVLIFKSVVRWRGPVTCAMCCFVVGRW